VGTGENRATIAARTAISSPLLEISIDGAKGVLFNITGGTDLTMSEVDEAAKVIAQAADADANIIFGAVIDDSMVDQVKITVIATGFDESKRRLKEMVAQPSIFKQNQTQNQNQAQQTSEEPPINEPQQIDEVPPEHDKWDIPAFLRQGRN